MKLTVPIKKYEIILGFVLLLLQQIILPIGVVVISWLINLELNLAQLNFIVMLINFVLTIPVFFCFLKGNLKQIFTAPGRFALFTAIGFVAYYASSIAVNLLIYAIDPDFANVNNAFIEEMTRDNFGILFFATVFLVPLAEECMYRGVIFRGLHNRSRVLAYIVSILVFSAIHVVGYIGTEPLPVLLVCLLQYIPAAFVLAWSYERTDSIFAPILIHTVNNCIGMLLMR